PDLILLDIMMPDMDGYEVSRQIKSDLQNQDIPIIFISALDDTENKIKAFTAGGVDYVTKPFRSEEVLARVQTHLGLRALRTQLQDANSQLEDKIQNLERVNAELTDALNQVKTLTGLLPICANCKKVRDDQGYWHQVEAYVRDHSSVEFSHSICPDCYQKLYPEFWEEDKTNAANLAQ
ncbi:MAG: response regulator, partial [Anaerolineae bacterium]|nr:response regulator [Anaerolineae bacterium]